MTFMTRLLWVLGVISMSLFILFSGRTNVRNFEEVQTSVEEIYEDRLVVKGLIFELSSLLHRKEIAQLTGDGAFYAEENPAVDEEIDALLVAFRATKLTPTEARTLDRFASHVDELQATERELGLAEGAELGPEQAEVLATRMDALDEDLRALSQIQLAEGRRRVGISDKAASDMVWFAWIETGMLVVFAGLLIVLVAVPAKPATAA